MPLQEILTALPDEVYRIFLVVSAYLAALAASRGLIGPLLDRLSIRLAGLFQLVTTAACLTTFPFMVAEQLRGDGMLYIITASYLTLLALLYRPLREIFSGDILRLGGSIRVGDYIDLNGAAARVDSLKIFNALLTTPDLRKIYIPHSELLTSRIVNLSKSGAGLISLKLKVDGRKVSIPDAKLVMLKTGTDLAKSELAPGRAAEVRVTDVDGDNVELQLTLYVTSPPKAESLAPVILERIYAKLADVTQRAYI